MRLTRLALALALCLALVPLAPAAAEEKEVDLELVLAVDISRSMDMEELRLQRDGYAAAFRDPQVMAAIRSGMLGRIAVLYLKWAGPATLDVVGQWTLIDGPEAAAAFADVIAADRLSSGLGTSISGALDFAASAFEGNGFAGLRRVIDVSGDGPNNVGRGVVAARDEALAQGIVINGLPVMMRLGGPPFGLAELDVYFEDCVIGGPQSFVLPVREKAEFAETIRRKLILEIAMSPPEAPEARAIPTQFTSPPAEARIDCMIGERLRRRWMEQRWGD